MFKTHCYKKQWLKNICCVPLLAILLFTSTVSRADCAKDLYSCGKAAGTLGYEILENSAGMLAYIIAGGPCIAAMSNGDPTTIGFTGLIMGLGATGVVRPREADCKVDTYGLAGKPIAKLVDKVVGTNLTPLVTSATGSAAIEQILSTVVVPSPVGTVSAQVYCGCHLLGTGAKAIDNAKEVAQAADRAYKQCGKAVNSCPGLKQALAAGKWVVTAAGDVVEFVGDTACKIGDGDGPAVSSQHMYQTHFEYMLSSQLEQDLANIPMTGSGHQNQFNAEMGFCTRHYDNRCQDGGKICNAIALQNYNPAYYALILEQLNGKLFNKYFFEHSGILSSGGTNGCPAPGGISLNNSDGGANAVLTGISKHCTEEVTAIIKGKSGGTSYKELARAGLPQNIDSWLTKIPTGKWITDSQKVYDLAIITASFAIDPLIVAIQDKYLAEYKTVANQGEIASIPYDYLDKTYRGWTIFKMAGGISKCPAGIVNMNGREKQCISEIVEAFGFRLNAAVTKGEFQSPEEVVGKELNGSPVYDIARAEFVRDMQQQSPTIGIKGMTQEQKYERALSKAKAAWANAAAPAATQAADNVIPQVLANASLRQADVRSAQEAQIIDLQTQLKVPYDNYIKKCKSKKCEDAMYQKWVTLVDKINAERTALQQATPPNKAFDAAKLDAMIAKYKQEIKDIEPQFKAIINSLVNQGIAAGDSIKGAGVIKDATDNKKAQTLTDKAGLINSADTPNLKDMTKDAGFGSGLSKKPLANRAGSASPQIVGMRPPPGMMTSTPNKLPDNRAVLAASPAITSVEGSQKTLKDRAESVPIKDAKPAGLGSQLDLGKKPTTMQEMPKPTDAAVGFNVKDAVTSNNQAGKLGVGVSSAAVSAAANPGVSNSGSSRPVGNASPVAIVTQPPTPTIVKNIPAVIALPAAKAPEPPFDKGQYQRVARTALENKWLALCKNESCKTEIGTLITSRISEVLKMLDSGTDLRVKAIYDAAEVRMDSKYNPLMQAKVDASKPKVIEYEAPKPSDPIKPISNKPMIKKLVF